MPSKERLAEHSQANLEVLLFTVGGVYCGIDGELVSRMLMCAEAEKAQVKMRWFHQVLSFGGREVV